MQPIIHPQALLPLTIEQLVPGGEGLAHWEGFPIFIPQGLPGDRVVGRIISVKPTYARALIEQLDTPSPQRVNAPCPVQERCGGCQWQALAYPEQLRWKQQLLQESMQRIGRIPQLAIESVSRPIIGMDEPWYYRNKAQFPFRPFRQQVQGGFFAAHSHELVALDKCYIQDERINATFRIVRELLQQYAIPLYDETRHTGVFRQLIVRQAFTTDQTLVGLVTHNEKFPQLKSFVADLRGQLPGLRGVLLNRNAKRGNHILGPDTQLLWGQEYLQEQLGHLIFRVSLPAFFQVNPRQTPRLYDTVLELAQLTGKEQVVDAYAGTGTIALWVAQQAAQVTGIEVIPAAIADGLINARLNGIANVTFQQGRVEACLGPLLKKQPADVVLLDPPRKGCEDSVLATLSHNPPQRIVYVSCHPATLARDSRILLEQGFRLQALQPVDMFPHTWHVETVALFERG